MLLRYANRRVSALFRRTDFHFIPKNVGFIAVAFDSPSFVYVCCTAVLLAIIAMVSTAEIRALVYGCMGVAKILSKTIALWNLLKLIFQTSLKQQVKGSFHIFFLI